MEDKRKILYNQLSKDYDLGDFDSFSSKLDDENKRKAFYDAVSKDYDLGDYNSFVSKISVSPQSNDVSLGGVGTQEEADSIFDANMERFQEGKPIERVSVGKNDDTQGSYQYKPEVQKHILENKPDMFKPKTVDMYGAHDKDKNEMDLMREGRLYGMKSMRAMSTIEEQLDERIKANEEALKDAYEKRDSSMNRGNSFVFGAGASSAPKVNTDAYDETIKNLIAEQDYLTNSKKLYEAAKNDAGFFQGMKDAVDASWITFGVSDLHNAERIANVQKKIESGKELSESEQSLITSLGLQQIVNEQYNELLGSWYKAGMTTTDMVPFMAEMAVSPLSGLGKTAMKASIKKFGEKGAKAIASKILSRTIGDVAGAAGMAVTTGMPSVMANALERQQGYVTTDAKFGSVEGLGFEGGENASDAWRKAITSRTIENWSEMVGQYFSPVGNVLGKGIKKGFSKMGLGKINEFLDNINSSNLAKVLDDFTEQTQWNGSLGEFAEEQVGMIADALLVGDTKWSDITDLDQQLDVALGVGVFGTFMSLLRIGGYRTPKYRARKAVEKADENGLNLFGLDWKNVKELILASPDEELSANLAAHTEFSGEQMKAAFMYANALKAQQAVNTYKEKEKIDKPSDVGVETESAYDEGFETTESYLKHYAKRELDFAESELGVNSRNSDEQQFAQMVMAGADSPVESINALVEAGYSEEQIQKAKDYYTAYHRMNGITDALIEDVDSQIESANNEVDANTNQDNGSVTRVVLRNGGFGHVVEGTVVRAEDGTVDVNNSDDVIYVRLENGEIKMVNPNKDLVGVAWMDSPERLKEYNNTILKQDLLDKAIGEIDWNPATPNPKVGDSFEMNGVPLVVAGMNENGLVVVSAEEWQKAQGKKDYAFQTQLIVPVSAYKDWASAQLDAQEEAANAQQESAITNGPVSEEVNTDVNNPVAEEVAQGQAEVQPVVEEAPVIPTKEDGSIDFVSYGKEGTFKTLGEKYGEKMPRKVEVTAKALAEDLAKAQVKLAKAEEAYDNAPIGREQKAEKARYKAKAELEAIQKEADFWAEMDAEIKSAQVMPGDEAANEILSMEEPLNGLEFAAQMLANGNIKLLQDSFVSETGFGNEESKKYFGLFASAGKGGMTIQKAGERLMEADRENGTNFFDQNDPNAGRNAIIEALGIAKTKKELANIIPNNRSEQARKEQEAEYAAYEAWVEENFHMSVQDYEAYNGPYMQELVKSIITDEEFNDFMSTFVDETINNNQYEQGIIAKSEGSSEVLSGTQPLQAERAGEFEKESGKVDGGVFEENGALPEGASGNEVVSQIEQARAEVDTNPTKAQKEAGNYKKGHVKIDGYDITIENPKGGVRSGTDKNGKKWSITMNNDYGYIRGTEAVDGDHIDVFLSDNPTEGNVFVIDQSNEDGSFDESKVMYGFNSLEEARAAYLSNYEKGWESRIMAITEVSKDEFKKWIDSSHRKTKAFSEYKSVKAEAGQGYSIEASNVSRMEDIEARITEIENERIEIEGELENLGNSNPLASAELISQLDQLDREQSELEAEYSGLRSMNDESNAILEEEGSNLRFRGQQAKEEKRRKPLRERAKEWGKKLGVKVKIMESLKDVTNVSARRAIIMGKIVTGWYEESTGEVCLYMPYLSSESEVDATYIHEVVAHKGLRGLLGDKFDEFCDQVWEMMSAADKAKFIKYPGVNGNTRAAADEYIAHLSETIDVSDSSWSKFTELIKKFLKAIGLEPKMTNSDIANAIKRSYQRLSESGNAENVGGEGTRFRTLEEINQTFNEELQQQIDGTLPNGHIYQLGSPSAALLSTGIADVPIELNSAKLEDKSKNFGHDYDLSELKDLVKAIHNPMAIFAYGDKNKAQNIIVEIQHEGKNFIVGLSIRPSVGGRVLDINSIRNVFPKDNAEWLNWISQGKMLYADKERIQNLINQQRTNLADVDYLDLDSIANIINSFENPTLPEEKTMFRTVYHGSAASFDKFDHDFMSTGEGNQSYGWGTYVTEAEGVGVRYANAAQRNNINWNLMDAEDNVREDERYIRDTQKELDEVNSITKFENPSQKARVLYLREKLSNKLAEYKDQLAKDKADLEKWGKMANEKGGRHLYQVDIPDNNGSNYLSYKTDNSQEVIDKVNNAYRNLLLQRGVEEEDINPDFAPFGRGVSGETIYNTFSRELGGDKAASEFLNGNGFVGIVYPVNEKKGGNVSNENNYVIFNEDDLNIVEHTRFRITPKMDAEYLEAVNSGDMEKAQKMVNEAAKMAMPNTKVVDENGDPKVVYHGTGKKFYTFKSSNKRFYGSPDAYFFTDDKVIGEDYSNGYLIPAFLNIENPKTVDFKGSSWSGEIFENGKHVGSLGSSDNHVKKAHEEGYDGAILKNIKDAISGELADRISTDYVAFESNQIKSAEAVTYDDNGKIIPLSERFNSDSNDLRFRTVNEPAIAYATQSEAEDVVDVPTNEVKYTMNNIGTELYKVSGNYMRYLYMHGTLGRVLRGEFAEIDQIKAKSEYDHAKDILGDYLDELVRMKHQATEPAQDVINDVIRDIEYSLDYYRDLALGKDVWRTKQSPRFRIVEKHRDNIQEEVSRFTSKYKSASVRLLHQNTSDKEVQEWTGIKNATAKELMEFFDIQKMPASFVSLTGKIIIFADKVNSGKIEKTLFHENLHNQLNHGLHNGLLDKFYESAKSDEKFSKWKNISDKYQESERHEEFFAYVVSNKMEEGNLDDVLAHLSSEEQNELFNILNSIGYEYEQERNRRTSRAGRRSGRYSMRNSNAQPVDRRETEGAGSQEKSRRGRSKEQAERIKNLFDRVADMGLDEVLGNEAYNSTMIKMYGELPEESRKEVMAGAVYNYNGDYVPAMHDYLIKAKANIVDKIVGAIRSALRKVGFDVDINSSDVKYLLWRSRKPLDRNNVFDVAEDIDARTRFRVTGESETRFKVKRKLFDSAAERPEIVKKYDKAVSTGIFNFIEAFQDRMRSLKEFMAIVVEETGKKVRDYENAYEGENQLGSKVRPAQLEYKKKFYIPLIEELNKLSDKYGFEVVRRYIYCKSGLERNEVLRQRDADETFNEVKAELDDKLAKGSITQPQYDILLQQAEDQRTDTLSKDVDYSGIRGMKFNIELDKVDKELEDGTIDEKSHAAKVKKLESDKQKIYKDWKKFAEDQVAALEGKVDKAELDELWKKINAATNETLRIDYECGMIDKATYDAEKKMMKYYIPLRNWKNDTAEDVYHYRHDMVKPVSSNQKKAKGRESEADNPIAVIALMAQNAIVRGYRNKMKQQFYAFVANRKTELASVRDVWYVKDAATGGWEAKYADTSNAADADEMKQIMEQFEADMEQLAEQGLAFRGKLPSGMNFRASKQQKDAHVVSVMIDGQEHGVYINGNPRVAEAINGLTNSESNKHVFFAAWDKLNRLYGGSLTSWDPNFITPNFVRDTIHSSTMMYLDKGPIEAAKYLLRTPKILSQVFLEISGNGIGFTELHRYFEEFVENGGETGYTEIHTLDDYKKEYDKLMNQAKGIKAGIKGWTKEGFDKIIKVLEAMNRISEDVNRFNAYVTARRSGETIQKSVSAAKNISVNFNRKGAGFANNSVWGSIAGFMSRWILFFNPSVQGIAQIITKSNVNKKRAIGMASTILASGLVVPMLNEMLVSAFGDGDEDDYWNQSDFKRRNNWLVFTGDGYVSIPLPPVLRELYGMGDIIYGLLTGHITPVRAALDTVKQVQSAIGFVNLMPEISQEPDMTAWMKGLGADITGPFLDIISNTNFMGRPIAKWTDYNEYDPEYERVYKGTSRHWVEFSKLLNEIGGDEGKRSSFWGNFINPAMMEHLFTSYTGGIGKTINNLAGMITDYAMGNEGNMDQWRKLPIVPRFYTPNDEKTVVPGINRKYYEYEYEYNRLKKSYKRYVNGKKTKEHPEYKKYIDEMKENGELDFIIFFEEENKKVKRLKNLLNGNPTNKKALEDRLIDMKAQIAADCYEMMK